MNKKGSCHPPLLWTQPLLSTFKIQGWLYSGLAMWKQCSMYIDLYALNPEGIPESENIPKYMTCLGKPWPFASICQITAITCHNGYDQLTIRLEHLLACPPQQLKAWREDLTR